MTEPRTIVIATSNTGKAREMRAVLEGLPVRWTTLADYPPCPKPVENADTFEGNARLKATYYSRLLQCWALADDSGLEVDALHGAPGVHSARYAGAHADDAANNGRLVRELHGVAPGARTARFRCVLALADCGDVLAVAVGSVEGTIIDEPLGSNGFGYDPHFLVPHLGLTAAQMPPELKNRISHRGQALEVMRREIAGIVATQTGD
ncbi:MAG: RdgB/HAM1 family non-canonical purine NTP pyrophosphatase [Planctomycetes bacterium]|nr:RdgB/HAM1 family non-canonical purine NTP pyrophosphatase [Planctomycetota bacterium]